MYVSCAVHAMRLWRRSGPLHDNVDWRTIVCRRTPVLSTCPLHTNSGCGKERRIIIDPWLPAKAAFVWNYLEVYWPCAGGLLAVNANGTQ